MSQQTPSPPASAAASSTASEPDSTSEALAGGAFVADPGPAFGAPVNVDPEDLPPAPAAALEELPGWDEPTVRSLLHGQGLIVHQALAADKESGEWIYTEAELSAIAPPLARILNRYDATRAAAGTGDEIALLIGLTGHVARSIAERRAVLRALEEPPAPITGLAPEPAGDVTWQAPQAAA